MSPHAVKSSYAKTTPGIYIIGLGSAYPPHKLTPSVLEKFASRCYDTSSPELQKLFRINRNTGIETRSSINDFKHGFATKPIPPTIAEIDAHFRIHGVELAAQACRKALIEARLEVEDVTHTVAVTCTSSGNPGFDILVNRNLGLRSNVDRILLHGVGCAGGLAVLRVASGIASSSRQGKAVRVLCYACEICTSNVRAELEENGGSVAAALFSDGAAAFVLCNEIGLEQEPMFQVMEWDSEVIEGTEEEMSFMPGPYGYKTVLSRNIPALTTQAVKPMFERLIARLGLPPPFTDLDWAVHPGGKAILEGIQKTMGLSDEQLRESWEIYRSHGNSSSPTVLMVLDKMRQQSTSKRNYVVAVAFGPGLTIEMAILRRC